MRILEVVLSCFLVSVGGNENNHYPAVIYLFFFVKLLENWGKVSTRRTPVRGEVQKNELKNELNGLRTNSEVKESGVRESEVEG